MTVVTRTVSSSNPLALNALEALATAAGLDKSAITFIREDGGGSIEMVVSGHNSFNATKTSSTANGLLECTRAISNVVPESGLWVDGAQIKSWIENAAFLLGMKMDWTFFCSYRYRHLMFFLSAVILRL